MRKCRILDQGAFCGQIGTFHGFIQNSMGARVELADGNIVSADGIQFIPETEHDQVVVYSGPKGTIYRCTQDVAKYCEELKRDTRDQVMCEIKGVVHNAMRELELEDGLELYSTLQRLVDYAKKWKLGHTALEHLANCVGDDFRNQALHESTGAYVQAYIHKLDDSCEAAESHNKALKDQLKYIDGICDHAKFDKLPGMTISGRILAYVKSLESKSEVEKYSKYETLRNCIIDLCMEYKTNENDVNWIKCDPLGVLKELMHNLTLDAANAKRLHAELAYQYEALTRPTSNSKVLLALYKQAEKDGFTPHKHEQYNSCLMRWIANLRAKQGFGNETLNNLYKQATQDGFEPVFGETYDEVVYRWIGHLRAEKVRSLGKLALKDARMWGYLENMVKKSNGKFYRNLYPDQGDTILYWLKFLDEQWRGRRARGLRVRQAACKMSKALGFQGPYVNESICAFAESLPRTSIGTYSIDTRSNDTVPDLRSPDLDINE